MTKHCELAIVGAGPAGLSAAIEAARAGVSVTIFDENDRPGGQLFKQIHKFFGSREHRAKERGYDIGTNLLTEAEELGVTVQLNSVVIGIYPDKRLSVMQNDKIIHYTANSIIIASGAAENMLPFAGWTLPGVIGAGAAQTMMNIHGIMPGERVLMVGSGNVGVVVGYQLLQAGCELAAVIDAAPTIGGYGVHAAKLARFGVPFKMRHTIVSANGTDRVSSATIAAVDERWQIIPGSEQTLEVDTICLAVGLSPMIQLTRMAGCDMHYNGTRGGWLPKCDSSGQTSIPGIYVAGDVAGIEEASAAMIQGQLAAAAIACHSGYFCSDTHSERQQCCSASLDKLRQGQFGHRETRTPPQATDEGITLSRSLLEKGYLQELELCDFPGVPTSEIINSKETVVIECTQNIPCDPCQDTCAFNCIEVGNKITNLPSLHNIEACTACGMCVAACPGQAIFLVNKNYDDNNTTITIPYEFLPLPQLGSSGSALSRSGEVVCSAEVIKVRANKSFDSTCLLTIKVPKQYAMAVRGWQV